MSSRIVPLRRSARPGRGKLLGTVGSTTHPYGDRASGPWPHDGVTVVPNMNPEIHLVMWVLGSDSEVRIMEYPITGWASPRGGRRGNIRSYPVCPVSFNPFVHDQWALVERKDAQETFHWPSRYAFPMTRSELVARIRGAAPAEQPVSIG